MREVETPEYFRVASTLCIAGSMNHSARMGMIQVSYDPKPERCGRCLLCILILQFPANDTHRTK